jgi:hypothetical protein
MSKKGWNVIFVILFLVGLFIGLFRGILASEDVAVRALEAQGYSNIQIVDHAWFAVGFRGCGESDAARFTARATNPAGNSTEVYVCTGVFFKGGTIRVR